MKYAIIPPCEELKNVISHFWVGSWDAQSQKPNSTYYLIASSLAEITFAFKSDTKHAELLFSAIQGQNHIPKQISVDGFYHLIGVSFYSYAMPRLFNIRASELNKAFLSLDTFLGYKGASLSEKIATVTTTQQRIKIISDYFISILKKRKWEDTLIINAIQEIRKRNGNTKIGELANDFHLSEKQFSRRFKECSGFSPKLFSKIIRFESAVNNYSTIPTLTELAYVSGYFDQAHFIHEFKSFTGFPPKDFWKISE